MPPFKDDQILIIAPGSLTTLAQLGLPESFTPAQTKVRSRMFPAPEGKWEPFKIREAKKNGVGAAGGGGASGDVEMGGTDGGEKNDGNAEGGVGGEVGQKRDDEEPEYEEDFESEEGAVWPLVEGRIVNMPAFLALLHHIHGLLSPGLHTPILLIAQPAWTAQDNEAITQFFFEKFKTPAFCIMDSALAISYAYGSQNATVVDVGYQKTDVTCVYDFSVEHEGRTISLNNSGGDAMTERLLELLGPKGWTKDMCEQLKKSPFCEILPAGVPLPGSAEGKEDQLSNPAAAASTGATSSGPAVKITEAPRLIEIDNDDDLENGEKVIDDDGVLDVASIVTSGKTQEFLAQQERKKADRKAAKDAKAAADAAAVKPVRLPNAKREKVMFHYLDRKSSNENDEPVENGNKPAEIEVPEAPKEKTPEAATEPVPDSTIAETAPAPETTAETTEDANAKRDQARAAKREEKRKARDAADASASRREIEVGTERFLACSGGILDRIAAAIHHTVLGVEPVRRSELWDNLIIVGNGSRVKGFKDALLATLNAKYLISPSSATIFTSELPSNLSTPMGTGAQTPQREFPPGQHPLPTGSSVNPLLLAATTASHQNLGGNLPGGSQFGGQANGGHGVHSAHSQTPTSIKTVKAPEYFPEFKNEGFEEAVFLGAQVAAKVIFVQDQGVSNGFLSRVQYNEMGPSGIHEVGLTF